jgi:hypothetical protein
MEGVHCCRFIEVATGDCLQLAYIKIARCGCMVPIEVSAKRFFLWRIGHGSYGLAHVMQSPATNSRKCTKL